MVTCRFAGYRPSVRLGAEFLEMHVRPLTEKDAEKFVHRWYAMVERCLARDVEQAGNIAREKAGHLINEQPIHEVRLTDFYMGRYPVTNAEYGRFLAATGYREPDYWADRQFNQPRQPVMGVNWRDAKAFAEWAGLQLPSEAQWEYACRVGSKTRYAWGDKPDCSRANYGNGSLFEECKDVNPGKTSPAGDYPPNAWGLYDMHGNVWEWCEDKWHGSYQKAPNDGSAWVDNKDVPSRVLRGGAWGNPAERCRTAGRSGGYPGDRGRGIGFRLVRLPGQVGE